MVKLGTVRFVNFMNVADETVNYDQPSHTLVVGPNGSCKTVLFIEGPLYLLYGITLRYGVEVTKAVRNGCNSMLVHGTVYIDGKEFTVVRSRGNKKLDIPDGLSLLDGNGEDINLSTPKATQEYLEKLIGFSSTSFKTLILMNGEVGGFAKLSGPKQREILDEVLMMREIEEASAKSKAEFEEAGRELEEITTLLEDQRKTLDALIVQLESADAKAEEWDRQRDVDDASRREKLQRLEADAADLRVSIQQLESTLETDNVAPQKAPLSETLSAMRVKLRAEQSAMDRQDERIAQVEREECDSCEQQVAPAHTEKVKKDAEAALALLYASISQLKINIATEESRDAGVEVDYGRAYAEYQRVESERRRTAQELRPLRESLSATEREAASLTAGLVRPTNPFRASVADNEKAAEELAVRIEANKSKRATIRERHEEEAVMVELFGPGGCRQSMLAQAVPSLTAQTNEVLQDLQSPFTSSFSVTRSGGLDVVLTSPVKAPSYEGASRGERMVADVAVLLSFVKLVRQRGSKSFGQTFFDEVFDPVDDINSERVSAVLEKMDGIFVLTHKPGSMDAARVWRAANGKLLTSP
jgi:DNA repair exonuclease SbcCD ATPase subunit